jgi:hypothetical protein
VLDQDFNWDLEIAKRKKRWKAKEEELRAEAKSQKPPDSEENLSLEVRRPSGNSLLECGYDSTHLITPCTIRLVLRIQIRDPVHF